MSFDYEASSFPSTRTITLAPRSSPALSLERRLLICAFSLQLIRNPSTIEQFQSQKQDFLKDIAVFIGKSFEMEDRKTLYIINTKSWGTWGTWGHFFFSTEITSELTIFL